MPDKNQLEPGDTLEEARAKSEATEQTPTDEVKNTPAPSPEAPKEEIPAWAKKLSETVTKLEAENEALKEIAGKNALRSLEISKKDHTQKIAHFKKMNDKVIIGWGKLDDTNFVPNPKDSSKENLFIDAIYIDGKEEKIPYHSFAKCNDLVYADLLEFKPMGKSLVKFPTGEELRIDFKFLNA